MYIRKDSHGRTGQISFGMPIEIRMQIDAACKAANKTLSQLMNELIKRYLEEMKAK